MHYFSWEIPQKHRLVHFFDPAKMGNLMTPGLLYHLYLCFFIPYNGDPTCPFAEWQVKEFV